MNNSFTHKYGLNVFHQQPEDLFEYASASGLKHIEINLSHENLSIDTFDANRTNRLKELSEKYNIQLSLHIPYYTNISEILLPLRKTNIKFLIKCLQIACEIYVTHVTFHIGSFYWFPVEPWARKRALNRFIKSLSQILKICQEKHIIISLENVVPIPHGSDFYLLGDSVKDFKYIFDHINSPWLKFCLDTGHANMAEGVVEYIKNFPDKLNCIHYHDNNGSDDEHLAVGKGTVPWQELTDELQKIKYDGPIISECRETEAHKAAQLLESYFKGNLGE